MNEQIEKRLHALEEEYQNGRRMLAELEAKESALRSSLLRISGAIQVLREFLPEHPPGAAPANGVSLETVEASSAVS
jgi:hypothetical protein